MKEIDIILKQLKILKKKGVDLDIVNDKICFVDSKLFEQTYNEFKEVGKEEWDGMSKDVENYAILDSSKYIIAIIP